MKEIQPSLIIPVFNEEENIGPLHSRLKETLEGLRAIGGALSLFGFLTCFYLTILWFTGEGVGSRFSSSLASWL